MGVPSIGCRHDAADVRTTGDRAKSHVHVHGDTDIENNKVTLVIGIQTAVVHS